MIDNASAFQFLANRQLIDKTIKQNKKHKAYRVLMKKVKKTIPMSKIEFRNLEITIALGYYSDQPSTTAELEYFYKHWENRLLGGAN